MVSLKIIFWLTVFGLHPLNTLSELNLFMTLIKNFLWISLNLNDSLIITWFDHILVPTLMTYSIPNYYKINWFPFKSSYSIEIPQNKNLQPFQSQVKLIFFTNKLLHITKITMEWRCQIFKVLRNTFLKIKYFVFWKQKIIN